MADETLTPDLTLLSGSVSEIARDLRLLRLQVDNIAARLATNDQRFTGIDGVSSRPVRRIVLMG